MSKYKITGLFRFLELFKHAVLLCMKNIVPIFSILPNLKMSFIFTHPRVKNCMMMDINKTEASRGAFVLNRQLIIWFTIGLLFIPASMLSQVGNIRLNETIEQFVLDSINADPTFHTAVKPYRRDEVKGFEQMQKSLGIRVDSRFSHLLYNREWISGEVMNRKVFFNPVITTELGPLFKSGLGYESERDGAVQELQLGMNLYTDIFTNLTADFSFVFMNWSAPGYLQTMVDSTEVIPRWGEYKNGDQYSAADFQFIGEISYAASKSFHFQLGRGKHFFGDGYRSLLLSDNAPYYNYFRATADIWRFKYVFLLGQHQDLNPNVPNEKYSRKYTASHLLSYNVTKWLNINFFETIIQQSADSVTNTGLDPNYFNPVSFFRPVEFNSGSPDNALIGVGGKIRISKSLQLYGQAIVDEFILKEIRSDRGFWGNKYGLQAGLKWRPTKRLHGFSFRGEMNMVRPFTYSHGSSGELYGSLHSPLAHPLGANFVEGLAIARYRSGRFGLSLKYIYAQKGLDTEKKNYGGDIHKDYSTRTVPENKRVVVEGWEENDFGHELLQGLKTDIRYSEFKAYYLINPKLNLALEFGAVFRSSENTERTSDYTYAFFGIRTLLFNNVLDY